MRAGQAARESPETRSAPPFRLLTVTPLGLEHAGLAVASARAGGVAILDGAYADLSSAGVAAQVDDLGRRTAAGATVGLRLPAERLAAAAVLLDRLASSPGGRRLWLVVGDWRSATPDALPSADVELVLEIEAAADLARAADSGWPVAGWLARGNECGGWVGDDPAFILAQRTLAATALPVYVQGGIGEATAAACRALGAAGVVVDDALLAMPESPLPDGWRRRVEDAASHQTSIYGFEHGPAAGAEPTGDGRSGCRVLTRPATASEALRQLAVGDGETWRRKAAELVGWGDPADRAWPVGQAIGWAADWRRRYRTTGRAVQAILAASGRLVDDARRLLSLAPDSPLARSHRTRYPIVQGPMTRVSDNPELAAAVAEAGGLPLLALGMMRGDEVSRLLAATGERLGDRPWGVGLIGFVPLERRDEQLAAIAAMPPPFALIAGGRPEHAARLEGLGIATYLHVPVPEMLVSFIDQGVRRFVFEGRECGGHVGPLSSFCLWQSAVDILAERIPDGEGEDVHVLFAGGIHDGPSAAMVAALAAPLAGRGMAVGVLMGTGYLFTAEAVSSGALLEEFQEQALGCERTVKLETGPGHVVRVAPTPFADEFAAVRDRMHAEGSSGEEISDALSLLALGRSRVAAKGLVRDGAELAAVDRGRQRAEGMFMMGRLATLRSGVTTIADLHADVSEGCTALLRLSGDGADADRTPAFETRPADVAIVGIGCLLPGADDPAIYWRNILERRTHLGEVPEERWDWRMLYSDDATERDRSASRWGGFFDAVAFDPLRFGIPPNSMKSISTSQLLTLEVVRRALADAGYEDGGFDRENASVILGAGANGDLEQQLMFRSTLPLLVDAPTPKILERLPEWTEESFPGVLANVTAGRVANRFDLGGTNYTVDSACASSLTALDLAVNELVDGRASLVIAGGVDLEQTPLFYVGFSRVQAMSPSGRVRTFDRDADGIVIGEGIGVVVLKRLTDAERDGDRVYAVIKGVAGSSDGKALGLTAPRPVGQRRALRRAYARAGFGAETIGLYEAHGTGTPVGDRAELETIDSTLREAGAEARSCAVGSVKTLIGHTKAAAGLCGLIKTALALHHRVLPPHEGVEQPLEPLTADDAPVYLLREPRPWLAEADRPRRAGVSAFGFGGTNFHAVLEEHTALLTPAPFGADDWTDELVVLRAADRDGLRSEVRALSRALDGASPRLADLAYTLALRVSENASRSAEPADRPAVAALVVADLDELRRHLDKLETALDGTGEIGQAPRRHVGFGEGPVGELAWLFPGQGAQHVDMAREAVLHLAELRAAVERADTLTRSDLVRPLGELIYPPATFSEDERKDQRRRLEDTRVAQPALGALAAGFADFARRLGLEPSRVAGHSYGELAALHAAGVLERDDFLRLSMTRGRLMAEADDGAMAAVAAASVEVEPHLVDGVVLANRNAPRQCVISGPPEAVDATLEKLADAGLRGRRLSVSGAFHSPLMERVAAPLAAALDGCVLRRPSVPVYANATGRPYPADVDALRHQLAAQLRSPVDFVAQVEKMYADGARIFVELGPKSTLCGLVGRILEGRPHLAVPLGSAGLEALLDSLARLHVAGVRVDAAALFADRQVSRLDLADLPRPEEAGPTTFFVDGGRVRRPGESRGLLGSLPLVDHETHAEAAAKQGAVPLAPSAVRAAGASPSADRTLESPADIAEPPASSELVAGYRAYQKTMRRFLETQERVLSRFLGGDLGADLAAPDLATFGSAAAAAPVDAGALPGGEPPALPPVPRSPAVVEPAGEPQGTQEPAKRPASPEPVESATTAEPMSDVAELDRDALRATIVELVAERTGYPPDMLGLDQDIEAELGVDSIKRIEILEALERRLPDAQAAHLRPRMDDLLRVKSLAGWVERLAPAQPERSADPEPQPVAVEPVRSCPRWVIRGRPEALPAPGWGHKPLDGLFLITDDGGGVANDVATGLRSLGAEAMVLDTEELASTAALEKRVGELVAGLGMVQGLVHLAPLAPASIPADLAGWRRRARIEVHAFFDLCRLCIGDLQLRAARGEAYALSTASLGGAWGRSDAPGRGSALAGGAYGVLKTLANECPGLHAKAIDLDADAGRADRGRALAERLLDELLAPADSFEIGYPGGERTVYEARPAPLAEPSDEASPILAAGDVVLITGGARGITAGLAKGLARPGVTMVLVGRSPLDTESPAPTAGDRPASDAELRRLLIDEAHAAGASPSPAAIEKRLRSLRRAAEARRNLDRLAQLGAAVEYHSVDVRDEEAMGDLIAGVYARHGRLDAVLHGAGVIDDRLIAAKSAASFAEVFDTKADSAFLLGGLLRPEGLRWVALFSSIAGRIGNRGQVDYAAANEVVNRHAWWLSRRWPSARVVAINWGPWRGGGMAEPGVLRQLQARGIEAIEPAAGLAFLRAELGARGEAEVIAGEGPWSNEVDGAVDALLAIDALWTPSSVGADELPS